MEFVTRLASSAAQYPLPIHGHLQWQPAGAGDWYTEVSLPALPAEHIVVPSFSQLSPSSSRFQFALSVQGHDFLLNPVPATLQDRPAALDATLISTHIDCWHTHASIDSARLRLWVRQTPKPEHYLMTCTARPLQLDVEDIPLPPAIHVQAEVPAYLSQMSAAEQIRHRICSPTALSMALSHWHTDIDWPGITAGCLDPLTGAYGSWPLAIREAAQLGHLGAVECCDQWHEIVRCLQQGFPVVCSIRFEAGTLRGAPLSATAGHLVVLYGLDHHQVQVRDPAGATSAEVDRRWDVKEFARAWLQRRGAAYILGPPVSWD